MVSRKDICPGIADDRRCGAGWNIVRLHATATRTLGGPVHAVAPLNDRVVEASDVLAALSD